MICALLVALLAPPAADPALFEVLKTAYAHFEAKAYPEAIKAFERAYAISPEPRFVLNIAVTRRKAGECPLALAAFERFFELCADCAQKEAAAPLAREARAFCQAPVQITTDPPGAEIVVDDAARGHAPLDLTLAAGPHVVRAAAPEHVAAERAVMVEGGVPQRVELVLARIVDPPTPEPTEPTPNRWMWGAVATSGVGLLVSGIFGWLLLEDLDAENDATTLEALREARSDAERDAVFAQVGLGVAVVGALAAVAFWAMDDEPGVSVGPGWIRGRF